MNTEAKYRLEFWVDEFNTDPKQTNFQIFRNERNDEFDEVLSEDYRGLADAGLTEEKVNQMLTNSEFIIEDEPDGGRDGDSDSYSERAYYYFDEPEPPTE